jgi:holo-[acyl-carrier protein] synthase
MKISVGNDIIENSRIKEALDKFGDKFLERVFTEEEKEYCLSKKDPVPYLGARFACKEAFVKALELEKGISIDFKEIELKGNFFGKKNLALSGMAEELFKEKGFDEITVSISHVKEISTAIVILYKK